KGQEWFKNAPGPQGNAHDNAGDDEEPEERDEDGVVSAKRHKSTWGHSTQNGCEALFETINGQRRGKSALLPGLCTMMQDRVDWLSEERKADYLEWREGILEWIDTAGHACPST